MILEFTMNKQTKTAVFKLGNEGFHQDLHRLCSVVPARNRNFDGERWHVKYADQYAVHFKDWWPEFYNWVRDFENQLELHLTPGVQL